MKIFRSLINFIKNLANSDKENLESMLITAHDLYNEIYREKSYGAEIRLIEVDERGLLDSLDTRDFVNRLINSIANLEKILLDQSKMIRKRMKEDHELLTTGNKHIDHQILHSKGTIPLVIIQRALRYMREHSEEIEQQTDAA